MIILEKTNKAIAARFILEERHHQGSISISVIPKGFIPAFRNGFAPVKIFNAIPSPLFSAAAELRALTPNLCHLASVPMIARLYNPLEKSCSIHPRRQYGDNPILFPSKNGS
jgi:hypothetical protein